MDKKLSSYLSDIKVQQEKLATNLTIQGVVSEPTELLNSLVPKVLMIGNNTDTDMGVSGGEINGKDKIRVRFFYKDFITGRMTILPRFYNKNDNGIFPTEAVGDIPENTDSLGNLRVPALIHEGWNYTQEQLNNLQKNIDVGAVYITADGWTYFILNVTGNTTGNISFYFNKNDNSTLTIDMGDNSPVKTNTTTGNIIFSHVYTQLNKIYVVKAKITQGSGTFSFGHGTASTVVVGGASVGARQSLIRCFVGQNVTSINNYGFYSCTNLTNITIPEKTETIGTYAFSDCSSLRIAIIPKIITKINNYVFQRNYNLRNISMPINITSLGNGAFFDCFNLIGIIIPDKVISIGISAFSSCYSLRSIVIPDSVDIIYSYAFYNCFGLIRYIFESLVPPTLVALDAFTGINGITVFIVPLDRSDIYKTAANWIIFANRIFETQEN